MNKTFNYQNLFPQPVKQVSSNCLYPTEIIENIKASSLTKDDKALSLINTDVWRYSGSVELMEFLTRLDVPVFIFTNGYQDNQIAENVFEISFPSWYLIRNRSTATFTPIEKNIDFGFSCLNNKCNLHRLILGWSLYSKNLISDIIFSQNTTNLDNVMGFDQVILSNLPGFKNYQEILPIRYHTEKLTDHDFHKDHTALFKDVLHDAYTKSFINIVTETECRSHYYPGVTVNNQHITEKSYKPFISGQVPLFLAPSGHLPYLESIGFETFEEILPSNYDEYSMFAKVQTIVNMVALGKEWAQEIYHSNLSRIQHNYDLVNSDAVDNMIIHRAKTSINEILGNFY